MNRFYLRAAVFKFDYQGDWRRDGNRYQCGRGAGYGRERATIMMRVSVFALMLVLAGWARADDCTALRAFNAQQPLRAAMKPMPCHCIPRSERMDKVYKNPPAGYICGNGVFYDKQCHQGLSCSKE